jgi:two-component system response regulator LytT
MINVVIIEDEKFSQDKLLNTLKEISFEINVVAVLSTVKESIEFFKDQSAVDIILSDVQLPTDYLLIYSGKPVLTYL